MLSKTRNLNPIISLQVTERKWFHTKKIIKKKNPIEIIMDADDTVHFANTPAQAEFLQHSLEQVARNITLYVNTYKTEFMCFKQNRAIK